MSLILGIHSGHESSAVVLRDGRLVSAVSEERLTRIKNDGGHFPDRTIECVLGMAEAARADIEELALLYTFFPDEYFRRETLGKELERKWVRLRRRLGGGDRPQMLLSNFLERLKARGRRFEDHFHEQRFLRGERFDRARLRFFDHHESHAMAAAYYSGFREAAVVTMDGNGDWNIHHTASTYRDSRLERRHVSDAHGASAGLFYSHITRLLGFKALRHEGKVVGLAALGNPKPLYGAFSRALRLSADGCTTTSDFAGQSQAEARRYQYLQETIRGHSRENISAAAQQVLEDVAVALIRNFLRETGLRDVALNGGVFANVKLNQRVAVLPEVERVFVFPAMSDTGNSVGAALLELAATDPARFIASAHPLEHVYWGPSFSDDEIRAALDGAGVRYIRLDEEALVERASHAIHEGRVVGWFQGRMEFGPRALGNRSMLARPTDARINDWLNQRLDRSEFMPFAPSVLEEHADAIFDNVAKARHTAEFMTITFDVKQEWRTRISAVVHVDGTARPQLVSTRTNPLYHRLISAYHRLSGIPLVLNTSFNVHEEPIVCAPPEAIRAYTERRVDCLAIGPFWLDGRT